MMHARFLKEGENCWVNAKAEKKITVKITRARPGANRSTQGVVVVRQGMRDGSTTTWLRTCQVDTWVGFGDFSPARPVC